MGNSPFPFVLVLPFLLLLPGAFGSLFCPHSVYPSADTDFEELRVQVRALDDPIQLGQPIYRLKRAPVGSSSRRSVADSDNGNGRGDDFRSMPGESPFRLFTSAHSSECPKRGCLHELALAEPRVPGTLFYHTDTLMGKLIPPGFLTVDTDRRLYCSIVRDDCGASVPIFRHFKMVGPRIYYAYSTSDKTEIGANFTRESLPMCFGWSLERPTDFRMGGGEEKETRKEFLRKEKDQKGKKEGEEDEANSRQSAAVVRLLGNAVTEQEEEEEKDQEEVGGGGRIRDECSLRAGGGSGGNKTVDNVAVSVRGGDNRTTETDGGEKGDGGKGNDGEGMAMLTEYDNRKIGTLRDHFYTTRKADQIPDEYKKEKEIGLVILEPEAANCADKCLQKMGQTLANNTGAAIGIFPLVDHKLVLMGRESADVQYQPTGEVFYCARESGQCGARIPLRRFWHLPEMDSILTATNGSQPTPALSISTWDGVLCYIWPLDSGRQMAT